MKLKGIIDCDFTNYKEPVLTLEFPTCDFKCDKLNKCKVCQNSELVYEPDIEMLEIDEHVKYLVVASDGVWEFLSNKDVMKIIKPYFKSGDVEGACDEVVNQSIEKWEKEEYGRDDITVVISFLGNPTKKKGGTQVNRLN